MLNEIIDLPGGGGGLEESLGANPPKKAETSATPHRRLIVQVEPRIRTPDPLSGSTPGRRIKPGSFSD